MGDYQIVCKKHSQNKLITHVGIQGQGLYSVSDIVKRIIIVHDSFHVYRNLHRVIVFANESKDTGRWYLTTNPDSIDENDLDFLPFCK